MSGPRPLEDNYREGEAGEVTYKEEIIRFENFYLLTIFVNLKFQSQHIPEWLFQLNKDSALDESWNEIFSRNLSISVYMF